LKLFFTFFLSSLWLFSTTKVSFENITQCTYTQNGSSPKIVARQKVENYNTKATVFLKRKEFVAENFYYFDGSIQSLRYEIRFEKMFIYGKNYYLQNPSGKIDNYEFKAESMVIYPQRVKFENFAFRLGNRRGFKLKFLYTL